MAIHLVGETLDNKRAGRMVEGLIDGSISEEEFAEDIAPWVVCLG